MILAGLCAGACVAAGLALHARDEGWHDSSSLGFAAATREFRDRVAVAEEAYRRPNS
jgi:hypothetical protein